MSVFFVLRSMCQVGGHFQDDGPELVPVVDFLQEEHAGGPDGQHGVGGPHPNGSVRMLAGPAAGAGTSARRLADAAHLPETLV
jgi:hypothetical protein